MERAAGTQRRRLSISDRGMARRVVEISEWRAQTPTDRRVRRRPTDRDCAAARRARALWAVFASRVPRHGLRGLGLSGPHRAARARTRGVAGARGRHQATEANPPAESRDPRVDGRAAGGTARRGRLDAEAHTRRDLAPRIAPISGGGSGRSPTGSISASTWSPPTRSGGTGWPPSSGFTNSGSGRVDRPRFSRRRSARSRPMPPRERSRAAGCACTSSVSTASPPG